MKLVQIYLYFFVLLIATADASAKQSLFHKTDKELSHSAKCVTHFKKFERKHSIPSDILHSISLQESGRKHSKSDKKIPWPWTVNVEGKGYYFESKNEAVSFVKKQFSEGKKSIDVGCMQISLLYHGDSFKSLSDAFEPKMNIEFGAKFLRQKFEQYGSWKKAIANYHSADSERGAKYQKSVLNIANNIEKHKFDYRNTYSILTPSRPLFVANYKQPHMPYYSPKRDRYKSSMMVYVPKNAYRRFN